MGSLEWPTLPIQMEDLPKIRELLTAEEYKDLLKRLVVSTVAPAHERAPERRWDARGLLTLRGVAAVRPSLVPPTFLSFAYVPGAVFTGVWRALAALACYRIGARNSMKRRQVAVRSVTN